MRNVTIRNVKKCGVGRDEETDLHIVDGRIETHQMDEEARIIDGKGLFVAPSLIDMHVHVFENSTSLGIHADKVGVEQGVLTVVDAGSTGIDHFELFKKEVIATNKTEVLYFLNVAKKGLCEGLSELADADDLMSASELEQFIKSEKHVPVGLKVRMSGSVLKGQGLNPLIHARKLAAQFALPLMVHIGNAPPQLGEVLNLLENGDIVTHCFHGKPGGLAHYPREVQSAVARGVHFDVGHGESSFSCQTVPSVLQIAPLDFSISTDIYNKNYHAPVGSLFDTIAKFGTLCFSLEECVRRVTEVPRGVLRLKKNNLSSGDPGDVTLFRMDESRRTLCDSEGYLIKPVWLAKPVATIKKGEVVWNGEQ